MAQLQQSTSFSKATTKPIYYSIKLLDAYGPNKHATLKFTVYEAERIGSLIRLFHTRKDISIYAPGILSESKVDLDKDLSLYDRLNLLYTVSYLYRTQGEFTYLSDDPNDSNYLVKDFTKMKLNGKQIDDTTSILRLFNKHAISNIGATVDVPPEYAMEYISSLYKTGEVLDSDRIVDTLNLSFDKPVINDNRAKTFLAELTKLRDNKISKEDFSFVHFRAQNPRDYINKYVATDSNLRPLKIIIDPQETAPYAKQEDIENYNLVIIPDVVRISVFASYLVYYQPSTDIFFYFDKCEYSQITYMGNKSEGLAKLTAKLDAYVSSLSNYRDNCRLFNGCVFASASNAFNISKQTLKQVLKDVKWNANTLLTASLFVVTGLITKEKVDLWEKAEFTNESFQIIFHDIGNYKKLPTASDAIFLAYHILESLGHTDNRHLLVADI